MTTTEDNDSLPGAGALCRHDPQRFEMEFRAADISEPDMDAFSVRT
ncbi:hypothetical protein [Paraburkholderia caffeinilytica]